MLIINVTNKQASEPLALTTILLHPYSHIYHSLFPIFLSWLLHIFISLFRLNYELSFPTKIFIMFKPLIKKVREESTNPSILQENSSDETNANSNKNKPNSLDNSNTTSLHVHRKQSMISSFDYILLY